MRRVLIETSPPWWLICGLLLILSFIWLKVPQLPKLWLYPIARDIAKASALSKMDGLAAQESEHFIIRYSPQDEPVVQMIIDAAEEVYGPVTASLAFAPAGKATIIVISDRQEMQANLGWSSQQSAMGVYWSGLIQVLSPRAWLYVDDPSVQKERFMKDGPVAHEFTHLVVDTAASGNYPRWFTEGMAQYQDYRLNGYEWITSTNKLDQPLYTLEELERDFDGVGNQSLAYRESFVAVRYMYEIYGDEGVRAVLRELSRGKTMHAAMKDVFKTDYKQFEQAWQQWARTQYL